MNMIIDPNKLLGLRVVQPKPPAGWMTFGPDAEGGVKYPVAVMPNRFQRWALRLVFGIDIKEP